MLRRGQFLANPKGKKRWKINIWMIFHVVGRIRCRFSQSQLFLGRLCFWVAHVLPPVWVSFDPQNKKENYEIKIRLSIWTIELHAFFVLLSESGTCGAVIDDAFAKQIANQYEILFRIFGTTQSLTSARKFLLLKGIEKSWKEVGEKMRENWSEIENKLRRQWWRKIEGK